MMWQSLAGVPRAFLPVLAAMLLLGSTLFASSVTAAGARAWPAVDPARIDAYLAAQMAADRYAGLGVAISHGDRVVYLRGFGSDGYGRPMTAQTLGAT